MLECQSPKAAFQFEHSCVCVCVVIPVFDVCCSLCGWFCYMSTCKKLLWTTRQLWWNTAGGPQGTSPGWCSDPFGSCSARYQLCGHGPNLLKAYFLLHRLWTNTETPVCCSCTDVGRTCGSDWYIVTVDFPLCFSQKINNVRKRHYLIRSCSRFEHIKKSCLCALC